MSIKIASMNFGDCDTILHNTSNGMKNIAEVLGPNGEVYWSATKELTGIPPLSIRSNGTMLLDYLISGNMTQTGTPTPQNPIQPQECGEMTGNILDFNELKTAPSGSIPGTGTFTFDHLLIIEAEPNTAYTMSATGTGSTSGDASANRSLYFCGLDITYTVFSGHDVTYTTSSDGKLYVGFSSSRENAQQYLNGNAVITINKGSTAIPYEPYGQYKIPILSANITTNVYLGEVPTTRKIRKYVIDGTENWNKTSNGAYYLPSANNPMGNYNFINANISINSHFPSQDMVIASLYVNDGKSAFFYSRTSTTREYYIAARDIPTLSEFKSYLATQYAAGTPVTVWYVLAEPETGIVNEPLRKIGDYADTLSYEQAGVQIPTNKDNTVIDVETTLKPSEMYIKYK